ncbi:aminopeptidase N [Pseudarthrobacter sp. J1738]|uniref:aminopeptidase N n=1 Tax=Pseudarthrobacter sp. J1738 TaxID=3420446 RepID=UPI003D299500
MSNQNLARDVAATRSSVISTHSYDVSIDIRQAEDPTVESFHTQSVITFDAEPGSSTFLDFIGAEVHSIFLNGKGVDVAAAVQDARIELKDLQAVNQVTVIASALYSRSGEGLHRFVDPADNKTYLYTQYEPADARRVFPNFEQPDLKARYTFHVIAPSHWEVASNGEEVQRTSLNSAPDVSRWDFEETKPMSTYITTLLAGPYFKATDLWVGTMSDGTELQVPLGLYCRASFAKSFDTEELFRLTKSGLTFFNELFDYPYPWGKYEQAFVPEYNLGAMENPGLVTFTEDYVFTSRATDAQYQGRANTLMHEMAHMWFGDLVTMSWWDDLWLKESFADYMGTLAVDQATDWDSAWVNFANKRKAWAYLQDQLPTTHPIVADIVDLEAAKQNFDGITYAKGASVLKQLVAFVGFEAFIAGARSYFRAHEFSNTTLTDLLVELSKASGRDLTQWAQQWLQTSGISTLSLEMDVNDGVITAAGIVQTATDPVTGRKAERPHRLRIGVYNFDETGALLRTKSIELDAAGPETAVDALTGQDVAPLLLLNDDDLSYAKIRLDAASEATVRSAMDRIEDPMARALAWNALWDSARDGVTPAELYVDAVTRFAHHETGVGVLQAVLANAQVALDNYVPAARRHELQDAFAAHALAQLQAAEPSSDAQLAWARALGSVSRSSAVALSTLHGLLDSSAELPGLLVDSQLRWQFWHALAAHGQATEAQLQAEAALDKTASGQAGLATALAARPDSSVKAAAWAELGASTSLSNSLLSATIAGFMTSRSELLAPYQEPYFAQLRSVWASLSIELASRIVRGLYPAHQDLGSAASPEEHPVIVASDEWLAANTDAPRALIRIIVEQRSHLLRALTAQAAA